MPSDYRKIELLGKAPNFISQTAEMLVRATNKHGNIVGSSAPRDKNRFIGNQDLLQGISHGSILGGTSRDPKQSGVFCRKGFSVDMKVRRRMNLDTAHGADKNRGPQFRDLVSQ
jgi:hypothetical protein